MRTLAAFAMLLLVAACQTAPPQEMTEAEKAQIQAEVEAFSQEYGEAWSTLDLDRALSLNVQTPEFAWAMNGVVTDYEATAEGARTYYAASRMGSSEWISSETHYFILSQDAAAILDVGKVVQTTTDGATSENNYTYTFVLVRRDGEWKILAGQGSFVPS